MKTVPQCIAMIMDGNRRWAREQGLATFEGHKKGLGNFDEVADWVREVGAKHFVVYALSTENWNRSEEEVSYLVKLFETAITDAFERLKKEGARLHFIGDLTRFPKSLRENMQRLEKESKEYNDFHVWICASYGARLEIEEAVKSLATSGEEVNQ